LKREKAEDKDLTCNPPPPMARAIKLSGTIINHRCCDCLADF